MISLLLFISVILLAYSNGSNDNFKGVASLYGSQTTGYRTAIVWATVTTLAGSLAAIVLAESLLIAFSGKGLVPDQLIGSVPFLIAVAGGAGVTVIIATFTGFPISTTHALIGALVGSGLMATEAGVNTDVLGKVFLLPLLLSPLLAVFLGASLYLIFRGLRLIFGITKEWCICIGQEQHIVAVPQPGSTLAMQKVEPVVTMKMDQWDECVQRYSGNYCGISYQKFMDAGHFVSAGVVSFARGLNDTPKIAALLLVLPGVGAQGSLLLVAIAIAVGGLVSARRVAETMSNRITNMNHGQGFSANLATGTLVIVASLFGMPVSTTHVSVGSLFGVGLATRQVNFPVMRNILLSWLITLPCAALIGGLVYAAVRI